MGPLGESPRRITSEGFNPSWSPDGSSIVYGMESIVTSPGARARNSVLWIVSTTTLERRQLTTIDDAVQPSWSPHGQRIAFWAISGDRNQRDIWTIAATGGQGVRVTSDAALDWSPAWSPEGRYLYFASNRSGADAVWRVAIDEASGQTSGEPEVVPLPRPGVTHFSFSRDGRFLAMASLVFQSNLEAMTFDVQKQQMASRRRITNNSETGLIGEQNAVPPSVAPDGRWLAVSQWTRGGQQDLWIVRTDGTGLRQLTKDDYRDNNVRWFPDGKRLVFRSDRSGRFQVWTIGADGGSLTQATDSRHPVGLLALSPDGHRAIANLTWTSAAVVMFDPRVAAAQQKMEELPTGSPKGCLCQNRGPRTERGSPAM